jgi:hypothetical protein
MHITRCRGRCEYVLVNYVDGHAESTESADHAQATMVKNVGIQLEDHSWCRGVNIGQNPVAAGSYQGGVTRQHGARQNPLPAV